MPTLELDFEVYCDECGKGLCDQSTEGRTIRRGTPFISVAPCRTCTNAAYELGREDLKREQGE